MNGPGLEGLFRKPYLHSGMAANDARVTAVIVRRKKHDARPGQYTDRSAAGRSDGLPAYFMTNSKLPLPGMAAISLWMLALALIGVAGSVDRPLSAGRARVGILILCTVFAVAGLGLIRLRRWGWALALGAVFCCVCFGCYNLFRFRQAQWGVMIVINLVFFLYLVRSEVIGRLR